MKTNDREAAVRLIKQSGNEGYVYEESNGWVTFVIEGAVFDIKDSVIFYNPGYLVHYRYMEDHGWQFRIFDKDEMVFEYTCDWTDELRIEKNSYELALIKEWIYEQGNSVEGLEDLFDGTAHHSDRSPAYAVAQKIGLVHYQWLSANYIDADRLQEDCILDRYIQRRQETDLS
ncbi:hypothetical protein [Paenibacillus lutrae]|uniref:hypothetical protein n=1 Tax=Paenibacillus lutrae TaxID=2078573 RepID=UPI00191375FF|nr:hypothetical protein [Paenibacillus lutrae]